MSDLELLVEVMQRVRKQVHERDRRKKYPDEYRAKAAKYYAANRKKVLDRMNRTNAKNKLRRKLRAHRHYEKNKALMSAKVKAWNEANKDWRRKWASEYRRRNPHIVAKVKAKRRMQIEATIDSDHAADDFIRMIRNSRRVRCAYCDKWISGKRAHIDHVVPLCRGGTHTRGNLNPSCGSCNSRKNTKLLSEWDGIKQPTLL